MSSIETTVDGVHVDHRVMDSNEKVYKYLDGEGIYFAISRFAGRCNVRLTECPSTWTYADMRAFVDNILPEYAIERVLSIRERRYNSMPYITHEEE